MNSDRLSSAEHVICSSFNTNNGIKFYFVISVYLDISIAPVDSQMNLRQMLLRYIEQPEVSWERELRKGVTNKNWFVFLPDKATAGIPVLCKEWG